MRKRLLKIFGAIILILLSLCLIFFALRGLNPKDTEEIKNSDSVSNSSSCPANISTPIFDNLPMDLDDFLAFRPLGFITIPLHILGAKHSNFSINVPGEPTVSGRRVEFPADATITQITSTFGNEVGYQIVFYPCKEFKSYFFHLGSISDTLLNELADDPGSCYTFDGGPGNPPLTKCEKKVEIKVKSGDLAGTSDKYGGVDFGAVDFRVTHTFANPSRYDGDYLHYVSPIPYFTEELKIELDKKLGSYDGKVKRTADPIYGTIAHDIPGTAQGNWFIGEASFYNTTDFSSFLSLSHDYVDPSQPIIAMGNSVKNMQMGLYSFIPEGQGFINRDFSDIKPGNVYCYENFIGGQSVGKLSLTTMSGSILIEMQDANTLIVERVSNACENAVELNSSNATTFLR